MSHSSRNGAGGLRRLAPDGRPLGAWGDVLSELLRPGPDGSLWSVNWSVGDVTRLNRDGTRAFRHAFGAEEPPFGRYKFGRPLIPVRPRR